MMPEEPSGMGDRRYLAIGGIAVVAGVLFIWYRKKASSSSSNAATGAPLSSPYATPNIDQQPIVPVILQTGDGGGNESSVPSPVPTTNGASGAKTGVAVPPGGVKNTAPYFTNKGVQVPQWAQIPNPQIGSLLAAAGVPFITQGRHQYYDPSVLVHINTPDEGKQLSQQGYYIFGINGGEFYFPGQHSAGRAGK